MLQDVESPVSDASVEAPVPPPESEKKPKFATSDEVELFPFSEFTRETVTITV